MAVYKVLEDCGRRCIRLNSMGAEVDDAGNTCGCAYHCGTHAGWFAYNDESAEDEARRERKPDYSVNRELGPFATLAEAEEAAIQNGWWPGKRGTFWWESPKGDWIPEPYFAGEVCLFNPAVRGWRVLFRALPSVEQARS